MDVQNHKGFPTSAKVFLRISISSFSSVFMACFSLLFLLLRAKFRDYLSKYQKLPLKDSKLAF